MMESDSSSRRVLSRFKSEGGEIVGNLIDLPLEISVDKLQLICNALLQQEEETPFAFFVNDKEITNTLGTAVDESTLNTEQVLDIVYQRQAVFRVRPVTRCTSSIPGHAEAVTIVNFSPDGQHLASGSGDTTVRFWDVKTQTPHFVCKGHKHWVLVLAWSPDGSSLASGCKSGQILLWDPIAGKQKGKQLVGHKQWITSLSWEPFHRNPDCRKLASSSKDGDVRVWDAILGTCLLVLSGHVQGATCVRWGGTGLLYSASQDRTIKVWRSNDGVLCRTLLGHAHWVNSLTLNTDYVLRTGPFEPALAGRRGAFNSNQDHREEMLKRATDRYLAVCPNEGDERIVSGSDDFTLFMWQPEKDKKPLARLTGHQQLVNDVRFSPDTRLLASASFDKSIKLWDGRSGSFLGTLRGHVQAVYVISWAADSRLLVSGSADSTLKVWNVKKQKLEMDLPGHADEVYAVDWSPDGLVVASGGKDKLLRL
ncbi:notchless protein homolog 1 isoform X2 [Hetaerina americana]